MILSALQRTFAKIATKLSEEDLAILVRDKISSKQTEGILYIKGEKFYTLEPPWLNNKKSQSCIPAGDYRVNFLPRSYSGKYIRVYFLENVPQRTGILIHAGNVVKHTTGCILIGLKRTNVGIRDSQLAMSKLRILQGTKSFNLKILGVN